MTACDKPETFTTAYDSSERIWLYKCDKCHERHYFAREYYAKQWANRHATDIPHARFCMCCDE